MPDKLLERNGLNNKEGLAPPLIVITGLSGAGKSTSMRVFEDLGYYCLDNLPPGLILEFYSLYLKSRPDNNGAVVASDVRSGDLFKDFCKIAEQLKESKIPHSIIYLDCSTEILMNRFMEVRRNHPLEPKYSLLEAIEEEKRRLEPILAKATDIIDTSRMDSAALRNTVLNTAAPFADLRSVRLRFLSFGFKYGTPRDADYVFDVRFLKNPFYVESLRSFTGEDDNVYEYVMKSEKASGFLSGIINLLDQTFDDFIKIGKYSITVAIGCTGGKHRSVSFARALFEYYTSNGKTVQKVHRDISTL
jgi:RNase adapter protein RapZ